MTKTWLWNLEVGGWKGSWNGLPVQQFGVIAFPKAPLLSRAAKGQEKMMCFLLFSYGLRFGEKPIPKPDKGRLGFWTGKRETAQTGPPQPSGPQRCLWWIVITSGLRSRARSYSAFSDLVTRKVNFSLPGQRQALVVSLHSHVATPLSGLPRGLITSHPIHARDIARSSLALPFEPGRLWMSLLFSRDLHGRRARATRASMKHGGRLGP